MLNRSIISNPEYAIEQDKIIAIYTIISKDINIEKHNKYKFVFEFAKKFLDEIIAKHPDLDSSILEKHLQQESKGV